MSNSSPSLSGRILAGINGAKAAVEALYRDLHRLSQETQQHGIPAAVQNQLQHANDEAARARAAERHAFALLSSIATEVQHTREGLDDLRLRALNATLWAGAAGNQAETVLAAVEPMAGIASDLATRLTGLSEKLPANDPGQNSDTFSGPMNSDSEAEPSASVVSQLSAWGAEASRLLSRLESLDQTLDTVSAQASELVGNEVRATPTRS